MSVAKTGIWIMMHDVPVQTGELPRRTAAPGMVGLAERGLLADWIIRRGIRLMCARRLRVERADGLERIAARFQERMCELENSPLALSTEAQNVQHCELPTEFFQQVLDRRLKYSCAYYPRGDETLDQAQEAMLALCAERAELADGQDILELGCGWGSLTLWMAERYPNARITAVSNSAAQRAHIHALCAERGLRNVHVLRRDVNRLELTGQQYDRCVSIEMFERLRNYGILLQRIASWLRRGGKLFTHMFVNRELMYPLDARADDNWLGRHFFTGGLMPAANTLLWFQRHLRIERSWQIPGTHYERTANHWLRNQDGHRTEVRRILEGMYGTDQADLWVQRWRMFWMACAELFGYDRGREWFVAHYRFARER